MDRIGKYRIDALIGQGAMGVVYRGWDPDLERPVAIKTVRREFLSTVADGASLERFAREARAAARCQHPNIVTVFDHVEQDGAPHLVMELVEACTLEAALGPGAVLPVSQVVEIARQVLAALDHAHARGVVHRDVKPANVLCPGSTQVKVSDFGLARLDRAGARGDLSGAGVIGTPAYMAPEQFLGRPADARSDIFAAGVMVHQLLTGSRPFPASDVFELRDRVLGAPPQRASALRPGLPAALDAALQRALARRPEDRHESAGAFAADLLLAARGADDDDAPPLDLAELCRAARTAPQRTPSTLARTLSPEAARAIERDLADRIGPLARVVVARALERATDPLDFVDAVAAHLPDGADIDAFRSAAAAALGCPADAAQVAGPPSQEILGVVETALIEAIGPIGRIVVQREAAAARDLPDLRRRLAAAIPDAADRARFLCACGG